MEQVFLTGATGFLGARLARKWLERSSADVTVMARSRPGVRAADRVREALAHCIARADYDDLLKRVTVLVGDLGRPQLGLPEGEYGAVARSVTHIVHCGALVRFDADLEDARRINLRGTEGILGLARACSRLRRLDYVSTAYVAGCRSGLIKEDELDEGQRHNNAYERSKFEAECLVSSAMAEVPAAILRPTLIVCDSRTGELPANGAFTRMLWNYARGRLPFLPGLPDASMDLVPAEYVVDAMFALSQTDAAAGRRFHLCAGREGQRTLADLADLSERHVGGKRPPILPPEEFEQLCGRLADGPTEETHDLARELALYLPYLSSKKSFDDSNARRLLDGFDLRAPALETYFARMAEFVRAESARQGFERDLRG